MFVSHLPWDESFMREFAEIVEHFGSHKALARFLDVSQQSISNYKAKRCVPLDHAYKLEKSGVSEIKLLYRRSRRTTRAIVVVSPAPE